MFIDTALQVIGLDDAFAVRRSALHLERGKPDPQVYLDAADALGERPEDSSPSRTPAAGSRPPSLPASRASVCGAARAILPRRSRRARMSPGSSPSTTSTSYWRGSDERGRHTAGPRDDTADPAHRYAVVVAGGSGTRLWPLSRKNLPKQMQALMSDRTLIVETVDRLRGVVPDRPRLRLDDGQLQRGHPRPAARDPARQRHRRARGHAAPLRPSRCSPTRCHERDPEAVVFSLASDHAITEVDLFQDTMRTCYDFIEAHPEHVALVGIKPDPARHRPRLHPVRERFAEDEPAVLRREVRREADAPSRAELPRVR